MRPLQLQLLLALLHQLWLPQYTLQRTDSQFLTDHAGSVKCNASIVDIVDSELAKSVVEALKREAEVSARKRKAEDEPDDPRSGVWSNISRDENTANPGGASSGSGTKRPAEAEANDSSRGDGADVGIVLPFECSHCKLRFTSRNSMFRHLYRKHDDDGEGAALRTRMLSVDPGRRPEAPDSWRGRVQPEYAVSWRATVQQGERDKFLAITPPPGTEIGQWRRGRVHRPTRMLLSEASHGR